MWIKGHNGHPEQTRADTLAYQAARTLWVEREGRGLMPAEFHIVQEGESLMASIAEASSLFEIDMELDELLEEMEQQVESEGQASEDLVARFQQFCEAHGEKVDRIGRFVRMMEAREQFCRSEAARLGDRARAAAGKVERTKNMVLYYLLEPGPQENRGAPVHIARAEE